MRYIYSYLFLGLFSLNVCAENINDFNSDCEAEIFDVLDKGLEPEKSIEALEGISEDCDGEVLRYNLGKLYVAGRIYDKAEESFSKGLEFQGKLIKELELAFGDVKLHQKDYAAAEGIYHEIANKYPDWWVGLNYLGFAQLAQNKFHDSVKSYKKSNAIHPQYDSYRNITLAYYSIGSFEKAIESLNIAFQMDESIVSDRDPMIVGAKSYIEIGKLDVAKKLLTMLLSTDQNLQNDEEFIKAALYLKEHLKDN